MANLFLASEILEMNIAEEQNGAAFYQALSESAQSTALKKAAHEIAEQEMMHEKRFAQLLAEVEHREPEESYPGEFDAYIQSLMRFKMFPDKESAIAEANQLDDIPAVEYAIKTEQATLNLLNELKKHIDSHVIIDLTINEEKDHIEQLNQILKSIKP